MAGCGISREEALAMMRESISNINLQRHCLASGAIMREIAAARGADQDLWEIAGLLHDLDYEDTEHDPARHGLETASRLRGVIPDEYVHAIESHNSENNGVARTNDLDRLLTASECVTGLITATALVYPERRLAGVEPQAVIKRMTKSGFARSVSREGIRECEAAGWDLDSFVATALRAMKSISDDLGL